MDSRLGGTLAGSESSVHLKDTTGGGGVCGQRGIGPWGGHRAGQGDYDFDPIGPAKNGADQSGLNSWGISTKTEGGTRQRWVLRETQGDRTRPWGIREVGALGSRQF